MKTLQITMRDEGISDIDTEYTEININEEVRVFFFKDSNNVSFGIPLENILIYTVRDKQELRDPK